MTLRTAKITAAWIVTFAAICSFINGASAQSFRRGGTEFNAVRSVFVPARKTYTAVVVEFLHHGEIRPDGRNVLVAARNKKAAPFRVLQVGPGDFCRLAFQTIKGQSAYDVFYGGDPPRDEPPAWTCRDGLLLETRKFSRCNLKSLESVRKAFQSAAPIGADYVEGVFHAANPCSLKREPFLSRYSGYLHLRESGTYGFFVSSRDCSFLLIDGKPAALAPGRHGPRRRATRGSRHDVQLTAGEHKFEYYHAAAGSNAVMSVAWEIDPPEEKPRRPRKIPAEVFHSHLVGRLPAGRVRLRVGGAAPDFLADVAGDVPLPDNDVPLVGVKFRDLSPKTLTSHGAKIRWDFGDGQTSDLPNVDHVYLRPGLYTVELSVRRGARRAETTNRIYVDRPLLTPGDKLHTLDEYLRIIETYDPSKLDAASLRQLALAFEAKALASPADQSESYLAKAVEAVQAAFRDGSAANSPLRKGATAGLPSSAGRNTRENTAGQASSGTRTLENRPIQRAAKGDDDLLKLAQLIGPMARFRLGDSRTALEIWRGAARRIDAAEPKAECEIAAAEVAVNDLLRAADAKPLLEAATKRLFPNSPGSQAGEVTKHSPLPLGEGQGVRAIAAELQRVWGDFYAATGDGRSARNAYLEAQRLLSSSRRFNVETAQRGAHARSTEEFLRSKQYVRAAEEIDSWLREFPAARLDGYPTLLLARYWFGRGRYAQAIAQAEQLHAVSPDSPYIDRLLFLAADCEMRLGRKDRALATLHSLVNDYPGSPLAPRVKKSIEILEGGK